MIRFEIKLGGKKKRFFFSEMSVQKKRTKIGCMPRMSATASIAIARRRGMKKVEHVCDTVERDGGTDVDLEHVRTYSVKRTKREVVAEKVLVEWLSGLASEE